MKTVLYFQSQSKTNSAAEKLVGVREIATKANWHLQVITGVTFNGDGRTALYLENDLAHSMISFAKYIKYQRNYTLLRLLCQRLSGFNGKNSTPCRVLFY